MFKVKAVWNMKGNLKMNFPTFSKLAGDRNYYTTEFGNVRGTCTGVCEFCGHATDGRKRPPCYVFKSYRYEPREIEIRSGAKKNSSVIVSQSRNTVAVRETR